MKDYLKIIPPRTLLLTAFCTCCLIALGAMYFFGRAKMVTLEKNVTEKLLFLKTQQELQPIYVMLQKYDTAPPKTPFLPSSDLMVPLKGNLSNVRNIFNKIASDSNVNLVKVVPDPSSISEEEQSIMITTVFSGKFDHFQKPLTMIALLPFVLEEHALYLFSDRERHMAELKLKISLK